MAHEVVAKVISINAADDAEGFVIEFWVGQELDDDASLSQAFALLGNPDGLQRIVYSMYIQWEDDELVMEPDEDLGECLAVFDEYEDGDALEPPLDRKWKTGQIAEAIVTNLVSANVFGAWRTGNDVESAEGEAEAPGEADAQDFDEAGNPTTELSAATANPGGLEPSAVSAPKADREEEAVGDIEASTSEDPEAGGPADQK